MSVQHLIDLNDITQDELQDVIRLAGKIKANPEEYAHACDGKLMATLFYEPSTRTQMSFKSAMLRLGGQVLGFDNPDNASVSKGETIADTVRVVSGYTDIVVMRTPIEGAPLASTFYSRVPVINAGDGGHLHPTQTLTDLTTLTYEKGRLENLTIGMCGDMKNGRTVHSLIRALAPMHNNKFIFISTKELQLPQYAIDFLNEHNCEFEFVTDLESVMPKLDVLYMTRIQKERFASIEQYEAQKGVFVLDAQKMAKGKPDLLVLHPLPRVDEITTDVDVDRRASYFKQTEYGMYARMALILTLLKKSTKLETIIPPKSCTGKCTNPKCIMQHERALPQQIYQKEGKAVCLYCDSPIKK